MRIRAVAVIVVVGWGLARAGLAEAQSSAAVEVNKVALKLTMPDRYQLGSALEPVRKVTLVAPADGMLQSLEVRLGDAVRDTQEVAQLDRGESAARLKVAEAEVKEKQALVRTNKDYQEVYRAQLEAALARAELARLELGRLTVRAPFAGKVMALPVSSGQYVLKGTTIAELADTSSLKAIIPLDRRGVARGAEIPVMVEDQQLTARVQSFLPLSDAYARLRELAAPVASAAIVLMNAAGELEPGSRIRSTALPTSPLATVLQSAVKKGEAGQASFVQVIRSEYVTNIPVVVIGKTDPEHVQIMGAFRDTDELIASSSTPLLAGTLVRFAGGGGGSQPEGFTPDPDRQGADAQIIQPQRPAASSPPPPRGRSTTTSPAGGRPRRQATPSAPAPAQSTPPF